MRLNKSTSHAIRILIDCARADGALAKVADISARLDITVQNVFKIVHILSRAELVAPVRGRHGGVGLARPPEQIRIGDIVRAMETTEIELDLDSTRAVSRSERKGTNDVNKVLDSALEAFIGVLDQHSLADMLKPKSASASTTAAAPSRASARKRPRAAADARQKSHNG